MKRILQGDIYLANLNPAIGHEQSGLRPVLVVQNDTLNQNLSTSIIAPLTSNLKFKGYLTTYFLEKTQTKLPLDSVVLLYQLRTLDQGRLTKRLGHLSDPLLRSIKKQLLLVL